MNKILYLLLIAICWSCTHNLKTEKRQNERDNIIDVRERINEIKIENIEIGSIANLYLIGDYLIISDPRSNDKLIHIFDKNSFSYLTSAAYKGEGPGEITNMGHVGIDESRRLFYVSDHGKQRIFSYNLDSVLANPFYMPTVKMKMSESQFPSRYEYINDTLCLGLIITPIGNSDFKPSVAKWNMNTGEIKLMKYEHPKIEKKRVTFAVSMEHGIYIECYEYYDLLTICDLDGNLKYNIYGPNWDDRKSNKITYYGFAAFCNDKILVSYSGDDTFSMDENGGIKSIQPTKFLVFDLSGNYVRTIETGHHVSRFCYDKENNRIIMNLDDEIQFAYLDLSGVV